MTLALASTIVLVLVSSFVHQGFYSDPADQLKTDLQYLAGQSPKPNDRIEPGPADISRDARKTLVYYAPGTPLAFLPFLSAGFTPAHAGRIVAVLAIASGSIGWACWFAGFDLPRSTVIAWALLVPWLRFSSNSLFLFAPDITIFATAPWVLLGALRAERATHARVAAAAAIGLAAGTLYIVKFSATFLTAGIFLWLAWETWHTDESTASKWQRLGAFAAAAAVPIVALSVMNQRSGGMVNILVSGHGGVWHWRFLVDAVGMPALTIADLDSLLSFLVLHPTHGLTEDRIWLSVLALPGGALLIALLLRGGERGRNASLARIVGVTSVVSLLAVWTVASNVSVEARHLASAGFAMLPLALAEGFAWSRESRAPMRRLLAAAAAVFVAAPLAYGVVSVFAKVWRYPSDYRPGPSGMYNPLLAPRDAAAVVELLNRDYDPATDLWYLVEPMTYLDLSGRAIVRHADFMTVSELREHFLTSRRLRIRALLPAKFEQNGKGEAIRGSFAGAGGWTRSSVSGAEYDEWTAIVEPGEGR